MRRRGVRSNGLTFAELLVLLAILAILAVVLLPALASRRESARRLQCESRLRGLIRAVQQHQEDQGVFPAGVLNPAGPIVNRPEGEHQSWIVQVAAYLDQVPIPKSLVATASVYSAENEKARRTPLEAVTCASTRDSKPHDFPVSDYAGVHHVDETPIDVDQAGTFFLNSRLSPADIADGLPVTLFLGEKRADGGDLGWMSGTRATLRNTGSPINATAGSEIESETFVGGFASGHPGGAQFAFGDGRVQFLDEGMDMTVYRRLANRADSQ